MRKIKALLLSLTLGLTAIGCTLPASDVVAAETNTNGVTMYRLYNPNSGEHFYTKNATEQSDLVKAGWSDEGIGWIAPEKSDTPVYRLYNENAGDHHYTMNAAERDNLISAGWKDEGTGWYSDDDKTVPLYREYNPNAVTGTHNYTTDKAEHDHLVSIGWNDEGIGWYAISDGKTNPPKTPDDDILEALDCLPVLPEKIENGYKIVLNPGAEYGAYLYDWNYAKANYVHDLDYLSRDEEQLKKSVGKAYSELSTDFNTYPDYQGLDADEYLLPGEAGRFVLLRMFEFEDSSKTLFRDGGVVGWAVCYVDVVNESNKKEAKTDCPILRILLEV